MKHGHGRAGHHIRGTAAHQPCRATRRTMVQTSASMRALLQSGDDDPSSRAHSPVLLRKFASVTPASSNRDTPPTAVGFPSMSAPWWKSAVVYQVYPRSFADSDGNGVGDLEGLRRRLDHLAWLGVDAVWLSPFYRSPMADFGYDVADFCDVDPLFGDLATFDRLCSEAHDLGIRIVVDLVPNHTSDQHPWFREAR